MIGKDLIKLIQERHLEDHDFCVTDRQCGYIKRSAKDLVVWEDAEDGGEFNTGCRSTHSYDTGCSGAGAGKVVILVD